MNALLIGDSHLGALSKGHHALNNRGELTRDVTIAVRQLGGGHILPTPFFTNEGDHAKITDPIYARSFKQLPPLARRFGTIGLSMPLWPLRVMYQMVREDMSLGTTVGNRRPISHALFERLVLQDQKYVIELIEVLNRSGTRVLAITPPALFRDHKMMTFLPEAEVLNMFSKYQKIMLGVLTRHQVHVIGLPEQCLDEDGFMLTKYRHEDPKDHHHANGNFGELMIKQVENWLISNPDRTDSFLLERSNMKMGLKRQLWPLNYRTRVMRRLRRFIS